MHICLSKLTIIGSDNGLSPGWRQTIIWTTTGILLIRPLGTNFNEMSIQNLSFSFMKMRLKVSSGKWRPFCLGLNVLRLMQWYISSRIQLIILNLTHAEVNNVYRWKLWNPHEPSLCLSIALEWQKIMSICMVHWNVHHNVFFVAKKYCLEKK